LVSFGPSGDLKGLDPEALKERMVILSEGKQPSPMRGGFYFVSGLVGLALIFRRWRNDARQAVSGHQDPN
jgi:hypothetical protein